MFSPPPTRLRRHIRPYKLAPIEREMYVQETISDSPFYSTTAYSSDYSSKLPPISSPAPSSIPMLIMTDDGGDDWEVLSEVKNMYIFCQKRVDVVAQKNSQLWKLTSYHTCTVNALMASNTCP